MRLFKRKTAKWIDNRNLKEEAEQVQKIRGLDDMPPNIERCILELLQSNTPANVKVHLKGFRSKSRKFKHSIPIKELVGKTDDFQGYLRENWGGGDYHIEIMSIGGVTLAMYDFSVDGENMEPVDKRSDTSDSSDNKEISDIQKIVAVMSEFKNLFGTGDKDFQSEMLSILMNNFFVDKTNDLERTKQLIELSTMLQPQVPPEDSTTALVNLATSIAPALLAAKQNQPMQTQSMDVMQQIKNFIEQNPAEAMKVMPQISSAIQSQSQQQPVTVQNAPNLSEIAGTGSGDAVPSASSPAPESEASASAADAADLGVPHKVDYGAVVNALIEGLRSDIREGETERNIAMKIIGLVQVAQTFSRENTPAFLLGLCNQESIEELSAEFDTFCESIPELDNQDLRNSIKLQIALILGDMGAEIEAEDESDAFEDAEYGPAAHARIDGEDRPSGEKASSENSEPADKPDLIRSAV